MDPIFAKAKGVFIYMWSLQSGDELAQALCNLGDVLLLLLTVEAPETRPSSSYALQKTSTDTFADLLRSYPWFESLWTLQEMILCPSTLWLAKNGDFCTVNSRKVTAAFIASACSQLPMLMNVREGLIGKKKKLKKKHIANDVIVRSLVEKEPILKEGATWYELAQDDVSILSSLTAWRAIHSTRRSQAKVETRSRSEAVLAQFG